MTTETAYTHQPMDMGEIYGRAIDILRRNPAVTLFIFLALFAAAVLYGYGNMLYIGAQADIYASGGFSKDADQATQQAALTAWMGAFVPFMSIMVIFFFTITLTQVASTLAGWESINDRPVGIGEVLAGSIRRPFWISLLQTILLLGILMVVGLVVGIVAFVLSGGDMARVGLIFGVLVMIAAAYPVVATIFRVHKVALESRGPWQGMISSIALVKGHWWRTFGMLFVVGLAMMALQLIVGFSMGTMKLPDAASADMTDPTAMAATLQQARDAYTWGYILLNGFLIALSLTFIYSLLTPMYVDLRARQGDFYEGEDFEGGTELERYDDR